MRPSWPFAETFKLVFRLFSCFCRNTVASCSDGCCIAAWSFLWIVPFLFYLAAYSSFQLFWWRKICSHIRPHSELHIIHLSCACLVFTSPSAAILNQQSLFTLSCCVCTSVISTWCLLSSQGYHSQLFQSFLVSCTPWPWHHSDCLPPDLFKHFLIKLRPWAPGLDNKFKWGLVYCLYWLMKVYLSLKWKALEICPNTADAFHAAFAHWAPGWKLLLTVTPMSLSSFVVLSWCPVLVYVWTGSWPQLASLCTC